MNNSEICVRCKKEAIVNTAELSVRDSLGEYKQRRKGIVKKIGFQLVKKKEVEISETDEFNIGGGVT